MDADVVPEPLDMGDLVDKDLCQPIFRINKEVVRVVAIRAIFFLFKALVFVGLINGLEEPVEGDGFYKVVKDIEIKPGKNWSDLDVK